MQEISRSVILAHIPATLLSFGWDTNKLAKACELAERDTKKSVQAGPPRKNYPLNRFALEVYKILLKNNIKPTAYSNSHSSSDRGGTLIWLCKQLKVYLPASCSSMSDVAFDEAVFKASKSLPK